MGNQFELFLLTKVFEGIKDKIDEVKEEDLMNQLRFGNIPKISSLLKRKPDVSVFLRA